MQTQCDFPNEGLLRLIRFCFLWAVLWSCLIGSPQAKASDAVVDAPGKQARIRRARISTRRPGTPAQTEPVKVLRLHLSNLEEQVAAGTLSRFELQQLLVGDQRPEPTPQRPTATAEPAQLPTGMLSSDCPQIIISDVRYHLHYDPLTDGPRFGSSQITRTLLIDAGNLQNLPGSGRTSPLADALTRAVLKAAPFTDSRCGAPSGQLDITATNELSLGQWSLRIESLKSSLR